MNEPKLTQALQPVLEEIEKNEKLLEMDWIDPESTTISISREKADRIVSSLPNADVFRRVVTQLTVPNPPRASHQWVGWMWRRSNGTYEVRSPQPLPANTPLFCLMPSQGEKLKSALMVAVGNSSDSALKGGEELLQSGRPVFSVISR